MHPIRQQAALTFCSARHLRLSTTCPSRAACLASCCRCCWSDMSAVTPPDPAPLLPPTLLVKPHWWVVRLVGAWTRPWGEERGGEGGREGAERGQRGEEGVNMGTRTQCVCVGQGPYASQQVYED